VLIGTPRCSTPPELGRVGCASLSGKKEGISAIRQRNVQRQTAMHNPVNAIKHPGAR
jgi:hypothetical protein